MQESQDLEFLLVEDDLGALELYTRMLRRAGVAVTSAMNGSEALELFRLSVHKGKLYDAALLDILIPKIDGITLADEIKRTSPNTYVAILTGLSPLTVWSHQEDVGSARPDGVYQKPVSLQTIVRIVDTVRERRYGMVPADLYRE